MQPANASRRALRVWDRLTQWYGQRIAEQYGPTPPADWAAAVDQAADADVQRALTECRAKHVSFPPTLPEFEALLRGRPKHVGRRVTIQERLWDHALATLPLSPEQLNRPGTFIYAGEPWSGGQNFEVRGLRIDAAGGRPAYRIMAEDLVTEAA